MCRNKEGLILTFFLEQITTNVYPQGHMHSPMHEEEMQEAQRYKV